MLMPNITQAAMSHGSFRSESIETVNGDRPQRNKNGNALQSRPQRDNMMCHGQSATTAAELQAACGPNSRRVTNHTKNSDTIPEMSIGSRSVKGDKPNATKGVTM